VVDDRRQFRACGFGRQGMNFVDVTGSSEGEFYGISPMI
jgi:hypothetical protein